MTRIATPVLSFNPNGLPISDQFGDIYFLTRDGLEETKTVFLQGNNLPDAWQERERFTIGETGFGTGLNFLAACDLFTQNPGTCRHLNFISVERYPLSRDELVTSLQSLRRFHNDLIDRLIAVYPPRMAGFHRIWFSDAITLTLIFDDAATGLSQLDASVDAWFLDGFSPAKNPDMWNASVYNQMARLSHAGTTISSFTAAAHVREGLSHAGFTITRQRGFGYKKHRITGVFENGPSHPAPTLRKAAIIGAGLAGAAMAQALSRHGVACTIFDRNPAPGHNASSNRLGLINPKIDLGHMDVNDLGQSMYSFALHRLRDTVPDTVSFRQNGALHIATDDVRANRQAKMINQLPWLPGHCIAMNAQDTQSVTGLDLGVGGIYFPDAATVNTHDTVTTLLRDITVIRDHAVVDLDTLQRDFDAVIIASSEALMHLCPHARTYLQPMRGQVTFLHALHAHLKCPVVAGNYVAPLSDTEWVTGATFQRNRTDTDPVDVDDVTNLGHLKTLYPALPAHPVVTGHWAQVRYTTPDRRPVLGVILPHVYALAGLGSHGLQYGFIMAEILAARLCGMPMPVGRDVLKLVDLNRYGEPTHG